MQKIVKKSVNFSTQKIAAKNRTKKRAKKMTFFSNCKIKK